MRIVKKTNVVLNIGIILLISGIIIYFLLRKFNKDNFQLMQTTGRPSGPAESIRSSAGRRNRPSGPAEVRRLQGLPTSQPGGDLRQTSQAPGLMAARTAFELALAALDTKNASVAELEAVSALKRDWEAASKAAAGRRGAGSYPQECNNLGCTSNENSRHNCQTGSEPMGLRNGAAIQQQCPERCYDECNFQRPQWTLPPGWP